MSAGATSLSLFVMNEMMRMMKYKREKTQPREVDITQADRVKRNLFGAPDKEQSLRLANAMMSEKRDRDMATWNFDFSRERPVSGGKLCWEAVAHKKPTRARFVKKQPETSVAPRTRQALIAEYMGKRKRATDGVVTDVKQEKIPKTSN